MPQPLDAAAQFAPDAPQTLADEALMQRYRDGDPQAFRELYARHRGGLYRFIARQCGEPAATEEIFQEVWLGLVRSRERYRPEASFRTWLYQMARNRVIDLYRARGRDRLRLVVSNDDDPPEAPAPDADPAEHAERRQQAERLAQAVERLPPPQREAFLLRAEGRLSLEEIAEITGANAETVKSRLRYALAKIREALGETS